MASFFQKQKKMLFQSRRSHVELPYEASRVNRGQGEWLRDFLGVNPDLQGQTHNGMLTVLSCL